MTDVRRLPVRVEWEPSGNVRLWVEDGEHVGHTVLEQPLQLSGDLIAEVESPDGVGARITVTDESGFFVAAWAELVW